MQRGLLALFVLGLAACASPRSDLPRLGTAEVDDVRLDVQRQAVAEALARERRVHALSWPILQANADLCPKTHETFGLQLGNARSIKQGSNGLTLKQIQALGYTDAPIITSVAPGSPAGLAGITGDDLIVAVGGEQTPSMEAISQAFGAYQKAREDKNEVAGPLELTLTRDSQERTVAITPVKACDVAVVSSPSRSINATANFKRLSIHAGLLRAVENDNTLSFVIAHELAHWAGRHPRKLTRNAGVTGAALWGPALIASGEIIDLVASPVSKSLGGEKAPLTTLTTKAAASAVGSVGFEQEADYAGLYMLVRAGGHTENVEEVFQLFANVSPRSSWLKVTHPTVPERLIRLEAAAQEIRGKQARGEPLIPDGWSTNRSER